MNKILFVLTSHDKKGETGQKTGYYLSEVSHPYHVLKNSGLEIDFVSPKGGKPPVDGYNLEDKINNEFVNDSKAQEKINNTKTPEEINPQDYKVIFFAGGHGTMWDFPDNSSLAKIAGEIYDNGGIVAAVCHGPAALINIKLSNGKYLVDGKNVSSFTNEEEEAAGLTNVVPFLLENKLKERGAIHKKSGKFQEHTEVSERLVTGQNPASATKVGEEIFILLKK
ncbi:MAG: type 1 glutamine amidotransferase domain-containing protein [Candidatus Sericytochromatia bacterium]